MVSFALVFAGPSGCSTSQSSTAYEVEKATIVTADMAYAAWMDYVRAGRATRSQYESAKRLYDKYYVAMNTVVNLTASLAEDPKADPAPLKRAEAIARATAADLIAFLNQIIKL